MGIAKPDKKTITSQVIAILMNLLYGRTGKKGNSQTITEQTDIYSDLGIDSVESLDFLTVLEEEFKINPDQFEANQKRTVSEIVDYIIELLNEKK